MSEPDYLINSFYSEEDEAYIADIPDFDMLSAHGTTPQEALAQVLIAKAAVVESMEDRGIPLPEPRYRPIHQQAG